MRVRISETASTASACADTAISSHFLALLLVALASACLRRPAARRLDTARGLAPRGRPARRSLIPSSLAAERVLDPVEHVACVVGRLIGRAFERSQPPVQVALLLVHVARHG